MCTAGGDVDTEFLERIYCKYTACCFGFEGKYNPPRVVFSREPKTKVCIFV